MSEAALFIQDLAVIMIAAALAGLLCRKIGVSPIVGYLLAGVLVGPSATPLMLVSDADRVHVLAELGLIFLMFGIGLGFSLRRLRELGLPVLFAAVIEGFLIFNLARLGGLALGLDRPASVFFAGMLVISSSAVIGKILTDAGRNHEKSSQLAVGVMLCEDVVVIILLTLLGSYAHFAPGTDAHGTGEADLLKTLGLFGGFVLVVATLGLLLVPRVLKRLSREATSELETVFVVGLLFGLSLMVVKAGYSLALGAFMLGAIVGDTPQRGHVERAFTGLQAVFGAMFFVAIGMTIDVSLVPGAIVPLIVLTTLALFGRALAASIAILAVGYDTRTAWRSALILTPIGEFSFIIAQMGTGSGLLPKLYMPAAVGASLLTAVISPILIRHNNAIASWLAGLPTPFFSRAIEVHRRILEALARRRESNVLWKLTRRRFIQIGIEITLVSATLVFAQPLIDWLAGIIGADLVPGVPTAVICWTGLGVVLLAPIIAIWRNLQAVTMILGDYLGQLSPALRRVVPTLTAVLQAASAIALALWLSNFIPQGGLWITLGIIALLAAVGAVLWRRMIRWHSDAESTLESNLGRAGAAGARSFDWMDRYAPWGLQIGELALPDRFALAGRTIAESGIRTRFGCSIIGIERQTFTISNPGPGSHLFPGDRLLMVGTSTQIDQARVFLMAEGGGAHQAAEDMFRDLSIEMLEVPEGSPAAGRRLADLNWPRLLGAQVVGHERGGARALPPPAGLQVREGDCLLVLGTPGQVGSVRDWLQPPTPEPAPDPAAPV